MAWQELTLSSEALRGNPLGDPHERPLFVWAPADGSRRYPTVYVLHAHMRSARSWFNVTPFERSYPEDVEALAPEAVVVLVDGWTSVGGSQWIDSEGVGRYGTYLCDEVVSFVDERFPTLAAPEHRGLQGKSSGGFGAVVNAILRPDRFGACATHAGDALFEVTHARSFAPVARALRDGWDGSLERFWAEFESLTTPDNAAVVEVAASALAYSGGALPFDVRTGVVLPAVWEQWLAWDPVRLAAARADAIASLQGMWIDAGNRDGYFLDLAATALHDAVLAAGLPEERAPFELFPGGHGGTSWRYPLSLAWLVERLGGRSITL
jgi:enterochelin esterase-like enzyme